MSKIIGKNISKNLSGKFSQKFLDHSKQSTIRALKTTSKRVIQNTAEVTDDLIGNETAYAEAKSYDAKITKDYNKIVQRQLQNEHDKEIPKRRYIYIYLQRKDGKLLMIWDYVIV